MTGYSN